MFFQRLISSIVLWTVVLGLVFSGWHTGSWLVIAAFGLLGQWEFYIAQEEKGFKVYKQSGVFCGFLLFLSSWLFLIAYPQKASLLPVSQSLILVLVVVGSLVRLVLSGHPKPEPIISIALSVLGFFYVPFLFNFANLVAFWPERGESTRFLLLYLLVVTKFSDIGAYLTGRFIGKHKMIPRVSPGKTWEGFAGGVLCSLAMSLGFSYSQAGHLAGFSLQDGLILGLILPLASVVGDLAESVIKRDAQIKDSGKTIPGIGGVLDLIDSILFTAPMFYFYLYWIFPH